MNSRNLIWCSVDSQKLPAFVHETATERNFDLLLHNYAEQPIDSNGFVRTIFVEAPKEEKLLVAARFMPTYLKDYDQIAFLDDDLDVSVDTLNRLFGVGEMLALQLFQPALTPKSNISHLFLREIPDAVIRKVPFVEIMCPFFSQSALAACLPTFDLNLSAWGLDCYLWPKKVAGECYVVDALPIGHYRPASRRDRVQRNGKTPAQECEELRIACENFK